MKTIDLINVIQNILKIDSGKIAYKRTIYILKLFLFSYIPLSSLCLILFAKYNYLSLPAFLFLILSTLPFSKYVLIPLSEKYYFKIKDKKV